MSPTPDTSASVTASVARLAAQAVLGVGAGTPWRIAAGRSCEAYAVESGEPGAREWVIRVPVPGTDRSIRFHAEAALGELLASRGHPVASWEVVDVNGTTCTVGERLTGNQIAYETAWTSAFSARLGDLLADLHGLPTTGFGPLARIHRLTW